jgi:pimeloyl-ACP methyl ester carboxylesterase
VEYSTTASPTAAIRYTHQAEKLSLVRPEKDRGGSGNTLTVEFVTPQDPVIITGGGGRLPEVPLAEGAKLNPLRATISEESLRTAATLGQVNKFQQNDNKVSTGGVVESHSRHRDASMVQISGEGSPRIAMPTSHTHPLFPPLPLYGPSTLLQDIQCLAFRISSFFLSLTFLGVIVLGSVFTSIPLMFNQIGVRPAFQNPDARRPFYEEEKRRKKIRKEAEKSWKKHSSRRGSRTKMDPDNEEKAAWGNFMPTEGGPDRLICDVGYYARRVGLDVEEFKVQTEDGFIITLWHVYNPLEYTSKPEAARAASGPDTFPGDDLSGLPTSSKLAPKFPVLMMHGLLQSGGAYCVTDDDSLAFYLCKSGYDVWIGNNRCGFHPEHTTLSYSDPRMWAWNIRQMGVLDLFALTLRVISETGFEKIGLVAHSQGTTQTFVALAKDQRPELGEKLTVFCALAPAAYAGPLIGKAYFKFVRKISPVFFRIVFGIHAFIPFMMTMHRVLPGRLYGALGYRVFSFLFDWSDTRWDRALRDRLFQFSPVYVSAESMRWWLGRECFAKHRCILATREDGQQDDAEDDLEDRYHHSCRLKEMGHDPPGHKSLERRRTHERRPKGSTAWYNAQTPPFALWVAGNDYLVDGQRLLRRFERGREPHVRVVHSKVIEEYEHLDVIWAMDSIEQVGREVRDTLWKTCNVRDRVRIPSGCGEIAPWIDDRSSAGGLNEKVEGVLEEESESSSDEIEIEEIEG